MVAVTADRVIVELEAKLDRYEANVRRAESKFDSATRKIAGDSKRMEREVSRNSDAVGARFRALAATVGAAFSARQVAQLADIYTRFTNQLKVAGIEGLALAGVQEKLFGIAQKNGVQLETLGSLYGRVSQSADELGASSADILNLTAGVAAGLRVQGSSAEATSGAILGLVQALGSARVKAEEFNQINEGAPVLLRAVAKNMEAAGGSVSRLRTLVIEGKVSNTQFFEAFLAGSAGLQAQAEKTNLTIANSFTVLNNALGKYIGEADQTLSATEQISAAIITLSENIDVVAEAIGVISAVLLGRFVAGMVAGAGATGLASTALLAFQARAIGAATTIEALALVSATAGRTMLAAFGGPVGLAVTALALGVGYLATQNDDGARSIDDVAASAASAAAEADAMEARLRAAGVAMVTVDDASGGAAAGLGGVSSAARQAKLDLYDLEQQAIRTATALVGAQLLENRQRRVELGRADTRRRTAARSRGDGASSDLGGVFVNDGGKARAAEAKVLDDEFVQLNRQRNAIIAGVRNGVDVTADAPRARPAAAPSSRAGGSRAGGGSRAAGPDVEAIAARFTDDVARGELELRRALAEAVGTAAARRDVEREAIRVEQQANARSIKADEDLIEAQRLKLLALNDQISAARLAAIAADAEREAIENSVALRTGDLRNQQDILRLQGDLADTAKERGEIELRLLDLQYEEERIRLQVIADSQTAADAEREAARRRLASLDQQQALEREGVERRNEGPLAAYNRRLNLSTEQLGEQAEQWIVGTLENVQSRLRDAISSRLGIDDPILSGLLDVLLQEILFKPIAAALQAAGQGGGGLVSILGIIASAATPFLTGQASGSSGSRTIPFSRNAAAGGHVSPGRMYRVNETGIEGFQPGGSGKIIPLGRMRGAGGGSSVVFQPTFNIDASGVNPDGFANHIVQKVRRETATMVGEGMRGVTRGVPGRVAQYERDGT